jgi:GNAT superfamily N-acetyltransferase
VCDTSKFDSTLSRDAQVELLPFLPAFAGEVVAMWRESFEAAVGVSEPHTMEQQCAYLLNNVVPTNRVVIAVVGNRVIGFVAASDERIDQLYVHRDYQGAGVGSQMLQWAKENSCGRLHLFTFERNERARRFYEARGFKIVARGFEKYWQLADIKYEWCRVAGI